jgi:hypothetical protein
VPAWTRSRATRRRRLAWWGVGIAAAAVTFALGVALGQALEEKPDPDRAPPRTLVRTLTVPLEPAPTTGG